MSSTHLMCNEEEREYGFSLNNTMTDIRQSRSFMPCVFLNTIGILCIHGIIFIVKYSSIHRDHTRILLQQDLCLSILSTWCIKKKTLGHIAYIHFNVLFS